MQPVPRRSLCPNAGDSRIETPRKDIVSIRDHHHHLLIREWKLSVQDRGKAEAAHESLGRAAYVPALIR